MLIGLPPAGAPAACAMASGINEFMVLSLAIQWAATGWGTAGPRILA
jgi:hypothetical protein